MKKAQSTGQNYKLKLIYSYQVKDSCISISMDNHGGLFWHEPEKKTLPLKTMPWKFQLPFYLKFLHNDNLAERFKNLKILGAIDLYIKLKFCLQEPLGLSA